MGFSVRGVRDASALGTDRGKEEFISSFSVTYYHKILGEHLFLLFVSLSSLFISNLRSKDTVDPTFKTNITPLLMAIKCSLVFFLQWEKIVLRAAIW